jgi:AraC family ethanolamine operon transcriptional activator
MAPPEHGAVPAARGSAGTLAPPGASRAAAQASRRLARAHGPGGRRAAISRAEDFERHCDIADVRATQLAPAAGAGRLESLPLPRGSILELEVLPFDVMVETRVDRPLLLVPLFGSDEAHINGRALWRDGAYQMIGSGTGCLGWAAARTPLLGISVSAGALETVAAALDVPVRLPRAGELTGVADADGSLGRLAHEIGGDLMGGGTVPDVGALEAELLETMARACGGGRLHEAGWATSRARSFSIVADAEAIAAEEGWRVVAVADVCRQIGVSETRLRRAFRDVFDCSPKRFFTGRALNAARRVLRDAPAHSTTVSDTAASLGFWHYGRFARDYKALFGELPSATLRERG